ncbi:PREDICTED: uncharacterized protein LOC109223857 [Nicotiana attenuata]|uniref:Uncharacterized protein n=1 Tax=Nicotiana attenuata TaxID=49451 RepID=A0A1J6J5C5_NICAT|nr:PREDICTED: uncharacterized protein LOC109223857 [Nicotiana attenuata]OIT05071.1 hypothetical protein A4A49_39070 [Nicotiana attenuata]
MASASKKWARDVYFVASRLYFLLILFQIPLFRFPSRIGTCTTPVEVSLSLLYANGITPGGLVKALLYPGAVAKAIYKNSPIPSYDNLLKVYKFTNMKEYPVTHDLQNLEVIVGSYLSVAGAFLGLMKSGRFSLIGILLITWGLDKQVLFRNSNSVVIYPTMLIALLSAFFSIRTDVTKLIRFSKPKVSLRNVQKAKYN